MGRIIKTESAGKLRTQLVRSVVLALRELLLQKQPGDATRDLAAFISLALMVIASTIDESVVAWEKRGYWLKADRFRMDWEWSGRLGEAMRKAVLGEEWGTVALIAVQTADKLKDVRVPERHRLGTPWLGAWNELRQKSANQD